ncbi:MAG: SLC13 family permease, partial [Kiritimatiellaeota bacterium]|nr:SLC13 family permease [Kiritimatiellota bacterium]
MHEENQKQTLGVRALLLRLGVMLGASALAGALARSSGIATDGRQVIAVSVFILVIAATLLFWNFRLAVAFIGISVLLGAKVVPLEKMMRLTELHIILFLVGMMTLVGVLKDLGLFSWLIHSVISMKRMTGPRFCLILMALSGILACVVDEVTSIVFMLALVFQVCDTLKVRPVPFVLMAVMATNIGSSGTMLGNPVGIFIGSKAGLTFSDFLVWATPVMLASLLVSLAVLMFYFRRDIAMLTGRLEARRNEQIGLGPLVRIPYRRGLAILLGAVVCIALHHPLEKRLGLEANTLLIVAPLAIAGVLMIYRNKRARHYIEAEVEWWTLLFFMMLFAVAGALEATGVTESVAGHFTGAFGSSRAVMVPVITAITAVGSAFVDNIVFVAAFVPVVKSMGDSALWWAMLFGACFGGNITAIGSTANIVALGMLEKRNS